MTQLTHNPFGNNELVGGIFQIRRQKLYLVLFIHRIAHRKVTHFAVSILYQSAAFGNELHGMCAEILEFAEGHRSVVSALVGGKVVVLLVGNDVVLQFAHHLKLHAARSLAESLACLVQRVFGGHLEGLAILGVEIAEDVESRNLCKRVDESCTESGYHIQVGAAGLEEREKARSVHTLARSQHVADVVVAVDDKIQRLQASIVSHIAELHHFDIHLFYYTHHVVASELACRFLQKGDKSVRV